MELRSAPWARAVQLERLDRRPEDRHRVLGDDWRYQQLLALVQSPTVDAMNNKYSLLATSAAQDRGISKGAGTIIAAAAPDIPIALTGHCRGHNC